MFPCIEPAPQIIHTLLKVPVWRGKSLGNLYLTQPEENPKTRRGDKTWGTAAWGREMLRVQNHSI